MNGQKQHAGQWEVYVKENGRLASYRSPAKHRVEKPYSWGKKRLHRCCRAIQGVRHEQRRPMLKSRDAGAIRNRLPGCNLAGGKAAQATPAIKAHTPRHEAARHSIIVCNYVAAARCELRKIGPPRFQSCRKRMAWLSGLTATVGRLRRVIHKKISLRPTYQFTTAAVVKGQFLPPFHYVRRIQTAHFGLSFHYVRRTPSISNHRLSSFLRRFYA